MIAPSIVTASHGRQVRKRILSVVMAEEFISPLPATSDVNAKLKALVTRDFVLATTIGAALLQDLST
jgi:hypothetical protein